MKTLYRMLIGLLLFTSSFLLGAVLVFLAEKFPSYPMESTTATIGVLVTFLLLVKKVFKYMRKNVIGRE